MLPGETQAAFQQRRVALVKAAVERFYLLVNAASAAAFDEEWQRVQNDFIVHRDWLQYVQAQWISKKERWAHPWTQVRFHATVRFVCSQLTHHAT